MFAGIPVKGENGSGLRVQFPVCCLCPDIRCVIGWGRGQVKGDNACATPDIADTSPIRFSSLFRGLRATKRPTTPVAICCIALLLSARVPPPRYDPSFYHYVHATSPLSSFFFSFFFAARVCRTTFDEPPLRLHRCLLARLSSSMLYGFSFFFFSFLFLLDFLDLSLFIRFFFGPLEEDIWRSGTDILYVERHRLRIY